MRACVRVVHVPRSHLLPLLLLLLLLSLSVFVFSALRGLVVRAFGIASEGSWMEIEGCREQDAPFVPARSP